MNDRDIIIPLLRLVVPGDHDPALDYYPATGPMGGRLARCPRGAFDPQNGYLTILIRNKNTGIRHGYRGHYKKFLVQDEHGNPKIEENFSLFSITLPDDLVVRIICRRPWEGGIISKGSFDATRHGDLQPILEEIRAIALQMVIREANGSFQ